MELDDTVQKVMKQVPKASGRVARCHPNRSRSRGPGRTVSGDTRYGAEAWCGCESPPVHVLYVTGQMNGSSTSVKSERLSQFFMQKANFSAGSISGQLPYHGSNRKEHRRKE